MSIESHREKSRGIKFEKPYNKFGLPWWLRWWRIHLQCERPGCNPWVGKIHGRRAWQPTPVFLPGESPQTEEPGGLQSIGWQRVGHDWATKHSTYEVYIAYHPYFFPIIEPFVTNLFLSLSLFFLCVLTLSPNSGWPSSLPDLPRVPASLFIFSLNPTCLHPSSWLSACSPDKLRFSFFFLLCRVESCSTENLELRKKVEVLENTNRWGSLEWGGLMEGGGRGADQKGSWEESGGDAIERVAVPACSGRPCSMHLFLLPVCMCTHTRTHVCVCMCTHITHTHTCACPLLCLKCMRLMKRLTLTRAFMTRELRKRLGREYGQGVWSPENDIRLYRGG